jgi:hypothetical protein
VASVLDANFRSLQLQAGTGVRITTGPGGQTISVTPGGTSSSAYRPPFTLYLTSESVGGSSVPSLGVMFGTVNGLIPSESDLAADGNWSFSDALPSAGSYWVYLTCTITATGRVVTGVEIDYAATIPADTSTLFHITLGRVTFQGTNSWAFVQYATGNFNWTEYVTVINGTLYWKNSKRLARLRCPSRFRNSVPLKPWPIRFSLQRAMITLDLQGSFHGH